MATDLSNQRCFNHGLREAVARCPGCGRFFCRECVTEHESRVLCVHCLPGGACQAKTRLFRLRTLWGLCSFVVSVLLIWFVVYAVGQGLLMLPSSFHEKVVWQSDEPDE